MVHLFVVSLMCSYCLALNCIPTCHCSVTYPHSLIERHTSRRSDRAPIYALSYIADTFASCLTHPFPSEGDIACENDSSNLYVNPLDGSSGAGSGGGAGGVSADFNGVRKSASGDGSVLCAKGSQAEGSPLGSRASLAAAGTGPRPPSAARASPPQPDEPPAPAALAPAVAPPDDAKPKHRKARFQQVRRTSG